MSLDLGTLAAKIKVDDSAVEPGLLGAERRAKAGAARLASGFNASATGGIRGARGQYSAAGEGVTDAISSGMGPGIRKIGGLLAGLGLGYMAGKALEFGVKTAMGMEKAEISFTTMLGSASKAQAFIGKMKEFAATTPFEFPELQTAAGKLMAAGIETDKVIPIMKTLGNVTSGMGTGAEGVNRATVAIQQMNAAGKITAEDLNQLRDAGIPVYDLLASALGKSKEEVAELYAKGKLGGKELAAMMKALETGKGLEKFNGLMDAQSQSLEGKFSTLKDLLGQGLAGALEPLMPFIKEGVTVLSDALPGLADGFKGFLEALVGAGEWVQKNKLWIGQLAVTIGVLVIGLFALSAAQTIASAGGFLAFVMQAVGAIRNWTVVQWLLNTAMAANPIGLIIVAIAALVAGLIYAYNTSEDFRNGVNAVFTAVGEMGRWLWNKALAPAFRAIVNGFAWIVEGLAGMLRALSNVPGFGWAKDAADKLDGMAKKAREAASGIKDIPASKSVKISITVGGADKLDAAARNFRALGIMGARAKGGPVAAGGLYLVGEQGPELVRFDNAGTVYSNQDTKKMLSGGGSRSLGSEASGGAATGIDPDTLATAMRKAFVGLGLNLTGGDRFLNQLSAVVVDDLARGVA